MLFCSFEFLFIFFPVTLLFLRLTPNRLKNLTLLVFSLIFYFSMDPEHLWLLVLVVVFNFACGYMMFSIPSAKKILLAVSVITNVSTLAVFKYLGLFGIEIALPVGISFYIFQCISYVKDVYDTNDCEKSIINFSSYITMFPQLVAGPIVKYSEIKENLTNKRYNVPKGIERFVFGLSKKMIIANYAGEIFENAVYGSVSIAGAWFGIIGYMLQIYFDFSGYSDMAIGIGKIIGFDFPENFNYPYTSKSIKEFWRRWHITLSSFFRDYVYIPLGGNRKGTARTLLNLLIIWSLTGLWHGAGINFLAWGLYYFLLLMFEKSYVYKMTIEKAPSVLRHIITLFAILFGWLIFAFEDTATLSLYFSKMFAGVFIDAKTVYELLRNAVFILIASLFSTSMPIKIYNKCGNFRCVITLFLFALSLCYIASSDYNPFLYFRF